MSYINHSRDVVNNIIKEVNQGGKALPDVKVRSYVLLANDSARFCATVTGRERDNDQAICEALSSGCGNRLHVVPASMVCLAANDVSSFITGILTASHDTVAVSTEDLEQYKCLSGNMYMDANDNLWSLRATESGNLMIKADSLSDLEELEALMQSVSTTIQPGTLNQHAGKDLQNLQQYMLVQANVAGGDYVTYVDEGVAKFGVIVASTLDENENDKNALIALAHNEKEPTTIKRDAIIDVVTDVELQEDEALIQSSLSSINIESMLQYYKSVFRRNLKYFEEFAKRVRSHGL